MSGAEYAIFCYLKGLPAGEMLDIVGCMGVVPQISVNNVVYGNYLSGYVWKLMLWPEQKRVAMIWRTVC